MTGPTDIDAVFKAPAPRYFSIDAGRAFLADLACALRASINAEGGELSDALIYLPTRRAVRALGDAFIETAPESRASLLPEIKALGDIDEDEFLLFDGAPDDELDLPPAISSIERRLTLARMVAAKDRRFDGQEHWAGALAAADELGKLLDSFYTEEISPDALEGLAPEEFAAHWRQSLEFLSIITEMWPAYLDELGLMDPADRRIKLIDRQTARWRTSPPDRPVIIAGTTGSTPAVARMMKEVAAFPRGAVILPGLDRNADDRFWESIDAPHPQSGLKQLLSELGAGRTDIRPWPSEGETTTAERREIISVALRPADSTDSWRDWAATVKENDGALSNALEHVSLVEASDEEREADAVALKIRETIETPGKTVFLVTPDRDLTRRVAMKLRRWDIMVDDSAGVPFANSSCGTFLRLTAGWLLDPSDSVALTAILRHPLFGGGLDAEARARAVNAMDRALRGLCPAPGAQGLCDKISADERNGAEATPLLDLFCKAIEQWPEASSFAERFETHLAIAETLAASGENAGAKRLWAGDDGEAGAEGLAPLYGAAAMINHDAREDYAAIFDQLIAKITVRRRRPAHPRIAILGPLEARLQHADVMILGGLNEGVWPRDAAIDPFLSRPMRKDLGLPSPESRIGLAAHDFAQLSAAPELLLTRASRAGGKPTKPSRWIVRLKNILQGADALTQIDQTYHFETLAQRLDEAGAMQPASAPSPRPPADARPREFYVTHVEKLLRDPYAVYARHILSLKRLDPHNESFEARHAGNLFHAVFQTYVDDELPADEDARFDRLNTLYKELSFQYGLSPTHAPFWRERAEETFHWFSSWDAARRETSTPRIIEDKGEFDFDVDGRSFTLSARADRIDQCDDNTVSIIDYKTGAPPTLKQTQKFSPQLPLTGFIAANGGFEKLGAAPVSDFAYVRIIGRKGARDKEMGAKDEDAARLIGEAETGLKELLAHFNDPSATYPSQPRAQYVDEYGDYDHLARRRERNAAGGEGGDG